MPKLAENVSVDDKIRRIFEKQKAQRWKVAESSAAERREKLKRLKAGIIAERDAIASAIYQDFRKAPMETELTEIHPTVDEIAFSIKHLDRWMKPQRVPTPFSLFGSRGQIRYEPKGVVLIFAPWNYPFSLLVNPLQAAIAAGNCVVTKPSEKTPTLAQWFEDFARRTFDESEVAVVQGGPEAGAALSSLPFDHIFFTGSTPVGRKVAEAAAKHLTPVTLELGGKSPAIIDEDCDLEEAARRIVWGKFVNAGQTCIAPDYVFVPRNLERAWLDAAKKALGHSYGETEEARAQSRDFCRMIDDGAFQRVKGLVEKSVAAGAKVEVGGRFDAAQRYIAPTILSSVRPDHTVMQDEIFGPVLPVMTYGDRAEVFDHVRAHGKPLALYLFTRNSSRVEEVLSKTTAGGTAINQALLHYANPHLPFGGIGESGQGSYHGHFGFKTFSHERAVLSQVGPNLTRYFHPPYGTQAQKRAWRALTRFE